MLSLLYGVSDFLPPYLNIRRLLFPLLFIFIPFHAYPASYGSGTYTQSLTADAEDSTLSGNITINFDSTTAGSAAILAAQNGQISGTVDSLNINLLKSFLHGIASKTGGRVELNGPVTISTASGLNQNFGIITGDDLGMHYTGPVNISVQGAFANAANAEPGQIIFDNSLTIHNEGIYSYGLNLRPIGNTPAITHLNGATTIQTSGQDAAAIAIFGETLYVNGPLSAAATNDADAILMQKTLLASSNFLTTRSISNSQQPNPQKIRLQGKIQLIDGSNQMLLDLAAESNINSQLDIAEGHASFQFHSPIAKWTAVKGSTIGSQGSLEINFVNDGIWQVPPDHR